MTLKGGEPEFNISQKSHKHELTYALVGNPNSGKTTLFNHLTGLKQKVANYPGVTVEKKEGCCYSQHGERMRLIDLPGAYSLSAHSPDEEILQQVLLGNMVDLPKPDRIICIIDANNLERTLYLAIQVMELGLPTILVLNMMDVVNRNGLAINIKKIEEILGVPVIPTQANKKESLLALKVAMSQNHLPRPKPLDLDIPGKLKEAAIRIQHSLPTNWSFGEAFLLLTGTNKHKETSLVETKTLVNEWRELLNAELPQWRSKIIQARYTLVESIYKQAVVQKGEQKKTISERLDNVLLHPIWGWTTLLLVLGFLFWSIFSLSEYPMGWISTGIEILSDWTENALPPGPLKGLIIDGAIKGVGSVLVFLPQIMMLFFFIGILESTGYLPRAAFLLDRIMGKVGLPGKAFVPLLSSFACAIPGIMSTRTLPSRQDRLATIMIAPWMSCSARLPVYLMMISILIPNSEYSSYLKTAILLGIYALGTLSALAIAWVFRKTLLKGKGSFAVMELPSYRLPSWKNITTEMVQRAMLFIKRAGKIILAFSIILWFLMAYPQSETFEPIQLEDSYMGQVGKIIEPVIAPLGYDWKIGIGLVASFAARELFVSTMTIVNSENANIFFTPLTCLSLIIFFIFAMQCMSTLAVVQRETNSWRWPAFQLFYMTSFAYLAALIVYQTGIFLGYH